MPETPYRILAVAATPFFVDRGGHIHIYEPIRALQRLGHRVTLVTYHIGRDLPNIDIRRIPNIPWYNKTDAGPSYHKLYLMLLLFWKTLRTAGEIKPDVIHAHGWDGLWVAWWVSKLKGIPFIFDMQGSLSGEVAEHGYARKDGLYFKFLSWLERRSLNAAPVAVTSSSQICDESRRRFNLSDDHLFAILDGVDVDTFSPENNPRDPDLKARLALPEKPIVIFTGLLKGYQGADDMLQAIRVLVYDLKFTDFHFLIIGFPDEDRYQAQAVQMGIAAYTTFVGKVPYAEIGRYLALADVAIAPKISMTEGDGKIYYYMAMGLPVVAYERPASREILGDLGIYARYHDPADLARAVRDTLENPDLMQARGRANREKAEQDYTWETVARRILKAYEMSINRAKKAVESQTVSAPRPFWRWFRLLMGLLGLLALISFVDVREVSQTLSSVNWLYLPPAWALMFASMVVKTGRWRILLQQNGVNISFQRLLGTYLIGTFYSQFLPGASAGGDAMRMAESSVDTGRAVDSVASVIIERAVGLISIVTTASLILLLYQPEDIPTPFMLMIHGLAIVGITALVVLRFGWFVGAITGILAKLGLGKIGGKVNEMSHALQNDLGEPRVLLMMVLLSLLANAFSMTAFYLALLALTDAVLYLTFIALCSLIITIEAVPLTPGALGVREGAYVFFLGYLAINEPTALSISLLVRLLGWSLALIGGLVLLQRGLGKNYDQRPAPSA